MSPESSKQGYRADVVAVIEGMLADVHGVGLGKMFGFPAFFVGKKLFACLYGDGVALKLPPETLARALQRPGVSSFEPHGRKMREWAYIARETAEDYAQDEGLLFEAVRYVSATAEGMAKASATSGTKTGQVTRRTGEEARS